MTEAEFHQLLGKLRAVADLDPAALVADLRSAAGLGLDKTQVHDEARRAAATLARIMQDAAINLGRLET